MPSLQPINVTAATLAVTRKTHAGATIVASRAAGITMTLPAATGTGAKFKVVVNTTITSNNLIIQVANGTDVMTGTALVAQDAGDTSVIFETAADSDTITMNGSTKGGIKGDIIELEDVASGLWSVSVSASGTGTEVTPFSAAVS
ncbi:hypothetical protein JVX98_13235 [Ensifer sp. PDNC004]|uniref:hypothetical protein n=1 Tax=Ensifer sp. PDNC004 TaxID=2811423 RepID=UPI001964C4FC|nr:hypothetical protein [Ensifer sp. PDNC004]QRY69178.1 hypothetical protein JVX98_13235 [Ensifer sp. PDNC004]